MPNFDDLQVPKTTTKRPALLDAGKEDKAPVQKPSKAKSRKGKEKADIFAGEETFSTSLKMLKRQQKDIKRLLLEEKHGLPTTQEGIIAVAIDEFIQKQTS